MKKIITIVIYLLSNWIQAQSYETLDSLKEAALSKNDYTKALSYTLQARQKAETEVGKQDSLYVSYTTSLGLLHKRMGDYQKAETFYLESEQILRQANSTKTENFANVLNNLAVLYKDMGDFERAEPYYFRSKELRAEVSGTKSMAYAESLNNLGIFHFLLGNYKQAEELYLEAIQIRAEVLGKRHEEYAMGLVNLGVLYRHLNRPKETEALYLEAQSILLEVYGNQHVEYAFILGNLGAIHHSQGQIERGRQYYQRAEAIYIRSLGKNHPRTTLQIFNIACTYKDDLQEQKLAELLKITDTEPEKHYAMHAQTLVKLARLCTSKEDYKKAWYYINYFFSSTQKQTQNIDINQLWADSLVTRQYPSAKHVDNLLIILELMFNLLEKEQPEGYKEQQKILVNLANGIVDKTKKSHYNEQDKLRLLAQSYDWSIRGLGILDQEKDLDKAFEWAEYNKSNLVLEALSGSSQNSLDLPKALLNEERRISRELAAIQASLIANKNSATGDSLRTVFNDLSIAQAKLNKQIEQDYPKYTAFKYKNNLASIADIQAALTPNTAVIEYVVASQKIYTFYIDKNQAYLLEEGLAQDSLTKRIKALHQALSNYKLINEQPQQAYLNFTSEAYWFYEKLLASVLAKAKGIEHLIIIPDANLAHLPFETFLQSPAPPEGNYGDLNYLLKTYKISYNYSATLWKENRQAQNRKNNGQILAMAANYSLMPEVNKRLPVHLRLRSLLSPLPAARQEVEILDKQFKGLFLYDEQASEKQFKAQAPRYGIIHLAMHGLLDKKNASLSSLAFSEDGDSLENNFLQAYEIATLELNADLVVLSACETGFGKFEKGNGTASLSRSFMYAGVPALVVSLWEVNDASTSYIMLDFYQNMAKGMDKAEALRQAKLNYLQAAELFVQHPAYWSAFIQIGDSRPIHIYQSQTWLYYTLALGAALLLSLAFWYFFKTRLN